MGPRKQKTEAGTKDFDDTSDEMIESLLQKAEANLSSTSSVGARPIPRFKPISGTQKNPSPEEDSVTGKSPHDGTVKRFSPPLSRLQKEKVTQSTAGEKWFDMPATEFTPTVKRDLTLLQMRDVLDPKRHYRSSAKNLPKYFQMGTIIESPTEFFSARIKKKDRKETIVQELLADQKSREYFKKKYNEIQEKSASGGKKWYRQLQERKKRR